MNMSTCITKNKKIKVKRSPNLKCFISRFLATGKKLLLFLKKFQSSEEVTSAINSFYHCNVISFQPKDKPDAENILEKIQDLLAALKDYDLNKIYLRNDSQLTFISQKIFGNYAVLGDALNFYYDIYYCR
jgi:CRISPR-associated protein Cpf1